MRDLPGGTPCAARGQFGFFQQNDIFASTFMRQMVGEAHTHHATADDHQVGVGWKAVLGHGRFL